MRGRHHYRRRSKPDAELDMTTFLNLMVVLVPFLLITAVFSRITIVELSLPSSTGGSAPVEASFRVEVDLPGVDKDDLKIEVENGNLIIVADRKKTEVEGFEARRMERLSSARFRRSFAIGEEIELEKASAEFLNGVLSLTLPKREKALPRRIEVS